MWKRPILSTALTLLLMLTLSGLTGCQTVTAIGGRIRATIEPSLVKADTLVGIANAKAYRINDIAMRLSLGLPVSDVEKAELLKLSDDISTATGIAKSSTQDALTLIRLLPEVRK